MSGEVRTRPCTPSSRTEHSIPIRARHRGAEQTEDNHDPLQTGDTRSPHLVRKLLPVVKALGYEKAHALDAFALELIDVAEPQLRDGDLLIEIRAVGINPGEAAIRRTRSAPAGRRVILGWEFAGVVAGVGPAARAFIVGDRVTGIGDLTRDGCWAERVAVDHRTLARIPDRLSFAEAASLPIGVLTAWEALFRDQDDLPRALGGCSSSAAPVLWGQQRHSC